jgi:hypothetical protein
MRIHDMKCICSYQIAIGSVEHFNTRRYPINLESLNNPQYCWKDSKKRNKMRLDYTISMDDTLVVKDCWYREKEFQRYCWFLWKLWRPLAHNIDNLNKVILLLRSESLQHSNILEPLLLIGLTLCLGY